MEKENRFKKARTVHNQYGSQSTKEVSQATGITKSLIEDIESTAGTPRNVGYLTVKKLAQYYSVSSDYLLGLSETPSIDEDIQVVCKVTGLSNETIEVIKDIKKGRNLEEFDYLIKEGHVESLADLLYLYRGYWQDTLVEYFERKYAKEEAEKEGAIYIDVNVRHTDGARRGIKADMIECVLRLTQEIDKEYQGRKEGE